jgi:hypothetical protein
VDLLNANTVDIDSETLDSYGDSEDMEEDNEGDDGEDECEEIEEEVFDLSQPKSNKRKRSANYTEIEDTCLVRAWSQVTVDVVPGSDQISKRYLQCIKDKFFKADRMQSKQVVAGRVEHWSKSEMHLQVAQPLITM